MGQTRNEKCENQIYPTATTVPSGQGRAMTCGLCDNTVHRNVV